MALSMQAPVTLEGDEPATVAHESISVDEANIELVEAGREVQNEIGQQPSVNQLIVAADQDDDELKFWKTIAIKAKLADCGRAIREAEAKIEHMKAEIKEEKEFLKGEQIRLMRLAGELADVIDDHPLPVDPNAQQEQPEVPKLTGPASCDESPVDQTSDAWRAKPTLELLDGLKGLGQKKLETLAEFATTAGDLEDLRGEAYRSHQSFKDVLPSGFGQKIADAIEDRLIHVAKCVPSAEDQAAAEREKQPDEDPDGEPEDDEQYEDVI